MQLDLRSRDHAARAKAVAIAIRKAGGDREKMAALLGVSRRTVQRLVARYAPSSQLPAGTNQHGQA